MHWQARPQLQKGAEEKGWCKMLSYIYTFLGYKVAGNSENMPCELCGMRAALWGFAMSYSSALPVWAGRVLPLPSPALFFSAGLKDNEAEFMQYRLPVGRGPSSKMCPRCAPHWNKTQQSITGILHSPAASQQHYAMLLPGKHAGAYVAIAVGIHNLCLWMRAIQEDDLLMPPVPEI